MIELAMASRDDLIALIEQQQATIAQVQATVTRLEQRIRDLEAGSGPARGMPGHKREQAEPGPKRPRRQRAENYARQRSEPTARIMHALDTCPHCGIRLAGGAVKRTREVIEITPAPAEISEHVYLERCCPGCGQRWTPRVELTGEVVGHSRLGIGLVSLIATLREEARLPLSAIQGYLRSVHALHLSVGGIVGALEQVARVGQATRERCLTTIRASPVVYADETGWRENGSNRYLWTCATPDTRYSTHGGRSKAVIDQVLGIDTADQAVGGLVSDFYAAYDHYPGPQQKCWVHLLRDIHELVRQQPADPELAQWAAEVRAVYDRAVAFQSPDQAERRQMRRHLMADLAARCQGAATGELAPQAVLCRRIDKHLHSLFVFVLEPEVAADNNQAERSLRHSVISRKISGGTRSAQGTQTKLTLATLFGTWRARGLNPYVACRQLLASPQP